MTHFFQTLKTKGYLIMMICLTTMMAVAPSDGSAADHQPKVLLVTSNGDIVVQLDAEKAPKTTRNFLSYVKEGFYEGTVFHRVIKGFMVQGGGMTEDMQTKRTVSPIENEADNGLKNTRGTLAMARTPDPHSATAQFFINTADNDFLNFKSKTPNGWGYCVFGQVVEGMDVVDAIEQSATGSRGGHQDVPVEPIIIEKVSVVE
jgi:peptidyl-prolyl cis-trans isomerase B (cyclophilin B)